MEVFLHTFIELISPITASLKFLIIYMNYWMLLESHIGK